MFIRVYILIIFIGLFVLSGCLRKPSIEITDEYLSVVNPGQIFGMQEVIIKKFDSINNCPVDEDEASSYTIVNRSNKKQVKGRSSAKVYFEKKHRRYQWKYSPDPVMADHVYLDVLSLKPNTWYRVSSEKYDMVLFLHHRKKGDYQVFKRYKPAGPW
jgi:hypothetical protein